MTKATQETPQASEPVTPKGPKQINYPAKAEARQAKVETKVALAIDLLARPEGTTLAEIETELSHSGAKADPRAWVSFDVRNVGYGVKTVDDRLYLVLPEGMTAPLAHREAGVKKAAPEAPVLKVVAEPSKKAAMRAKKSKKAARKVAGT